jgi:hypothetical protein
MVGKIDFIVCEEGGAWYISSLNVPDEIACQSNDVLSSWAKCELIADEPGIVFVGVYWRDDHNIISSGITEEAAMRRVRVNLKMVHAS